MIAFFPIFIGHTSLLYNIFEVDIAEAFSEPWRESEVRDFFMKTVNSFKAVDTFLDNHVICSI